MRLLSITKKTMRIAWLADFDVDTRMGGAQLTNQYVIEEGRKRGHVIDEIGLLNLNETDKFLNGYDFYIINNYVEIAKHKPGRDLLSYIVKNKIYMKYAHDYDYSPEQTEEDREFQQKLYRMSLFNVALSPLHKRELENALILEDRDTVVIPPYIDTDLFQDRGVRRNENMVIALGEVAEHKGIYNIMKWANQNEKQIIDFYGFNMNEFYYFNLIFNKPIEYSLVPLYLNMYESFIHLPNWKEPFGRTVAEAYLCGCKMITNENIGFNSYQLTDKSAIRLLLESGPSTFWKVVAEKYAEVS